MEYRLEKSINKKGVMNKRLGVTTYTNDLDYCLIEDFIKYEESIRKARGKAGIKFAIRTETLQRLLDAIYAVQETPSSNKEKFRDAVWRNLPCAIVYMRDIESRDFIKELWYTGEFIEQLLESGANYFVLNEWVDIKD